MFLILSTAIAVFFGLFKAAAIALGVLLGVGVFAWIVGLLFLALMRAIIEGLIDAWYS